MLVFFSSTNTNPSLAARHALPTDDTRPGRTRTHGAQYRRGTSVAAGYPEGRSVRGTTYRRSDSG